MKKSRPIRWWRVIIITILLLVGGFILYSLFKPKPQIISPNEFRSQIVKAAAKKDDKEYFIELKSNIESASVEGRYHTEIDGKAREIWFKTQLRGLEEGNAFLSSTTSKPVGDELIKELIKAGAEDASGNAKIGDVIFTKDTLWNTVIKTAMWNTNDDHNKKIDQRIMVDEIKTGISFWDIFLRLFPTLLLIGLMVWIFRMQAKSMGGTGLGGTNNQAIRVKTNKKFKDIAGNAEVKQEVEELVDYLKNPAKYSAAGARIPKGILLGGPPGTGKTLLAKATAGEASVPFYFISASNFVEMFVGLGAKRVRDMFKEARSEAPAIIFIDELDAIGRRRGSGVGGGNDEREQTLNQILVEMDGITENSGILIMAATNRTDILDPALLRPGRFDRTITVNLPDVKEREEILKLHATGKRLSPDVKFENLAKRTPGYSGAQLENVINEAAILSVRENTKVITSAQIDEAIDRVMSGPAKKGRVISPEELQMVAYHEAGHAVVGLKVPGGNKVQKITIIPRGNAGGYNLMLPEVEKYNMTKKEMLAMIASYMGGRAAEEIIYGKDNISTGAGDDIARATKIARKMVTEYGMSNLGPIKYEEDTENPFLGRDYAKNSSFSSKVGHEIDIAVREIITEAEKIAQKTINENRELHKLIADALLENETIVKEEIDYIAKHLKLPPKKEERKVTVKEYSIDEILYEINEEQAKINKEIEALDKTQTLGEKPSKQEEKPKKTLKTSKK
ncbi:ATPase, AAA family [Mycoplasmopsis californica]|uniref:ATP-dependent zinc metalloprotease FtsH n=1 Tax=Mycoplasmopsis equigenitalium TaxID=114883 RepID=A0ABY5J0V3_9BACT|nr:ATP-dependent zinc metalloprotease FtsH [Mycoplasmopsis equigenitalium]UUD36890.1 ATP-dependent zinc metalloprotease FtsH [Mycoplasmopsis equigenitalium]VEU69815.1 ATPase, AAA family [Mycoplasmopsis californica]